jgi:hypothetical protein
MPTLITVPPQVIPRLREGAQLQLSFAAHEIAASAQALHRDDPPLEERRKMDRLWALLYLLGWSRVVSEPIELDLHEHCLALLIAVDEIGLHMQTSLDEMPDDDQRKLGRTDELRAMHEFESAARLAIEHTTAPSAIRIPPTLLGRVREGAYGLLAAAGEALVRSALVHAQPEPIARPQLERAWALIVQLGWTPGKDTGATELGIAEHGATVHAAIETMLPFLTAWFNELEPADTRRPEPCRRAPATAPIRPTDPTSSGPGVSPRAGESRPTGRPNPGGALKPRPPARSVPFGPAGGLYVDIPSSSSPAPARCSARVQPARGPRYNPQKHLLSAAFDGRCQDRVRPPSLPF